MLPLLLLGYLALETAAFKAHSAIPKNETHDHRRKSIVTEEHVHDEFGYPTYTIGGPDWEHLNNMELGRLCSPEQAEVCGKLVCRQGVCSYCQEDKECASMHECIKRGEKAKCQEVESKAWENAMMDPYGFLCTLLILVSAALAAAAGTGGGSIFVPLLISLSHLKASAVVALAQFMILVGSLVNLSVFVARRHPDFPELPVIDYDCIVVLIPTLSLGVTFGVLVNRTAPSWLLLVLLSSTLCFALYRTGWKGWRQYQQEVVTLEETMKRQASEEEREKQQEAEVDFVSYSQAISEILSTRREQVMGILLVWLLMAAASQHGFSYCSMGYALVLGVLAIILLLFSVFVSGRFRATSHMNPIDWLNSSQASSSPLKFPLVAFCTGFLGAMLGLGGGILLSPVFLEVGMHSEAVQATTASFVFVSSSIATIQYFMMDQIVWHYAVWYGAVTLVGTYLGQTLCEVFIRKRRRYSFITIAVACVLGVSLVCLLIVGIDTVLQDYKMGKSMWFSFSALCKSGRAEIITHTRAHMGQLE